MCTLAGLGGLCPDGIWSLVGRERKEKGEKVRHRGPTLTWPATALRDVEIGAVELPGRSVASEDPLKIITAPRTLDLMRRTMLGIISLDIPYSARFLPKRACLFLHSCPLSTMATFPGYKIGINKSI